MAPPKVHRRDTLRKAKAAYNKRGGPVITEKERRQLKRRAELRDRAEKIKIKEERKKANKEKREKKFEREREAKQRQGFKDPEPKLPQGQITLGDFLKKSKGCLQTEPGIEKALYAKEANDDQLGEQVEGPINVKEAKCHCQVRFVEPEPYHRIRLLLRLKSPPPSSHPSTPNSAASEQISSLEIGSLLPKSSPNCQFDNDDWASLFPSDTQVGRELRECSPLLGHTVCKDAKQTKFLNESTKVGGISLNSYKDELIFTQSVWDSLPSDTQVQRELDESPSLLSVGYNTTGLSSTGYEPPASDQTKSASRRDSNRDLFQESIELDSKTPSPEISAMSSFGVEDFPEDEVECDESMSLAGGLKAWSTQWLPSSTAEVSAFFDSDIDD